MMNLNAEQANALGVLLQRHAAPGPVRIEGGPGGRRYVSFPIDEARYELRIDTNVPIRVDYVQPE